MVNHRPSSYRKNVNGKQHAHEKNGKQNVSKNAKELIKLNR